MEQRGLTAWPHTDQPGNALPAVLERRAGGYVVTAFPALVDERDTVAVQVFDNARAADIAMLAGTRRLLLLGIPSPIPAISNRLTNDAKLTLMRNPSRNIGELMADCVDAAVDALVEAHGGPARDEAAFLALRDGVRADLHDAAYDVIGKVRTVLAGWSEAETRLSQPAQPPLLASLTDIRRQLGELVYPGFVAATGAGRLTDLTRYLRAIERRVERLPLDPVRDRAQLAIVTTVHDEYAQWLTELPAGAVAWPEVRAVRWMIEGLRVNLFAQALGTPYPISEKRIYRAMDAVEA